VCFIKKGMEMNDEMKLHLKDMIKANNTTDQTELIRELKHSSILRDDINKLVLLKAKYSDDPDALMMEAMNECSFLFNHYTDVYNKIRKDEMDMNIMFRLVDVLEKIENGLVDQHMGSVEVGTILKEIYVDSALKKAKKLDAAAATAENNDGKISGPQVDISWDAFKKQKQC
jgi:hypothetical protein